MLRLALVLTLFAAPVVRAQNLMVYGTFSDTHLTSAFYNTLSNSAAVTSTSKSSLSSQAADLGLTVNFGHTGAVAYGFDFRGSPHGYNGINDALAGVKATYLPRSMRIKPYAQISFGYLNFSGPVTATYVNYPGPISNGSVVSSYTESDFAFEALGGADVAITPFLDLRVVELGIGATKALQINPVTAIDRTHDLFTVNSGIVFHLPVHRPHP